MKYLIIFVLLFASYSIRAQTDFEKIDLPGLKSVHVDTNIKVILIASPANYLSFAKDDNARYIRYSYRGGELRVSKDERIDDAKEISVYLYFTSFEELRVDGSSVVSSLSIIEQKDFRIITSGNATVDVRLELKSLTVSTNGNSRVTARGNTVNEKVEADGTSMYRGDDLVAQTVILNLRGTGSVYVWSDKEIKGRATAGTEIYYRGIPARIRINSVVALPGASLPYKLVHLDGGDMRRN